jgi:hypothetical protein
MHEGNPPGSKPERPSNASRSHTTRRSFKASVWVAFFASAIIVCCVSIKEREKVSSFIKARTSELEILESVKERERR